MCSLQRVHFCFISVKEKKKRRPVEVGISVVIERLLIVVNFLTVHYVIEIVDVIGSILTA